MAGRSCRRRLVIDEPVEHPDALQTAVAAVRSVATFVAIAVYVLIAAPPGLLLAQLFKWPGVLYVLGHGGVGLALKLAGIKTVVRGREHLTPDRAVVFCANHQSNVDPPVLFQVLHRRLHILYKAELSKLPLLGRVFILGEFVPVERANREAAMASVSRGAQSLRAGNSFLIFPEGTRSRTRQLLPFKKGGFIMALQAGAPDRAGRHRRRPRRDAQRQQAGVADDGDGDDRAADRDRRDEPRRPRRAHRDGARQGPADARVKLSGSDYELDQSHITARRKQLDDAIVGLSHMETLAFLGRTLGFSFAAGINLYATVALIGLASRFGWVVLPGEYAMFDHDWVIGTAIVLYVVEFIADKVPWVDTLWDSVHTFIRPVGGALVAVAGLGEASPATQGMIALLGGAVAAGSHVTKAGTRVVANTSPEPISNWLLSLFEDALVVALVGAGAQVPAGRAGRHAAARCWPS